MKIITAKTQLSLGLVCMLMSVLCSAMLFGLVPEQKSAVMRGRADLCESVAIVSSQLIAKDQTDDLAALLSEIVDRNAGVLSAAIRTSDGNLVAEIGDHESFWQRSGVRSTENEILVPIQAGASASQTRTERVISTLAGESQRWGNVELRFTSVSETGFAAFYRHPWVLMTLFVSAVSAVMFYFYLRKMLKHLDPSKAVRSECGPLWIPWLKVCWCLIVVSGSWLANEAFSEWVGVPADKLTGVRADAFNWNVTSKYGDLSGYPWKDALKHEMPQAGVMIGLTADDKPQQNLMANASPVLGHDGKYGGVLVSFDDVTQLEETRKDLSVAKEQAEQAQQAAEDANSAKSDFLARMSHEIRTPMNAILGYTEVLRSGFDDDVTDRNAHLDTIHASGEHLLALINDILDLSKIESGQMELDCHRHSLRELISQVVSVMNVKAKEKSVGLVFEANGLLPKTIHTDAVRFRQAVFNLVGNAVKFTEEGEVRIVVGMTDTGLLKVEVIDTGVGIAADAVDKVFERFTQANAAVSTKFGGTGLGLSISKRLARMMGGDITVASVLGEGSTFTLSIDPGSLDGIPLVDPTVAEAGATSQDNSVEMLKLPACRILIVDDEKANRGLAGIHIRRAGGTFAEACNGQEAVDIAAKEDFDVILMDFNMPVMGGLDATRRLREMGNNTPVIALTANVMQDDRDSAMDAGCNGFLTKPIKMADLINGIRDLLPQQLLDTLSELSEISVEASVEAASDNCDGELSADVPAAELANSTSVSTENRLSQIDALLESLSAGSPANQSARAAVQSADSAPSGGAPVRPASTTDTAAEPLESTLPIDDPEFYEIVATFPPRLRNRIQAMQECLQNGDVAALREHAHWLKGTGETLGFAAFTAPARALEAAAAGGGQVDGMDALVAELTALSERVVVRPPAGMRPS